MESVFDSTGFSVSNVHIVGQRSHRPLFGFQSQSIRDMELFISDSMVGVVE